MDEERAAAPAYDGEEEEEVRNEEEEPTKEDDGSEEEQIQHEEYHHQEDEEEAAPADGDEEHEEAPVYEGEEEEQVQNEEEEPIPDDGDEEREEVPVYEGEEEEEVRNEEEEERIPDDGDEEGGVIYSEEEKEWDFDRIMEEKKRERSKKRKRRKDGSIDLCSNADGQIRHVVDLMKNAAAEDREANNNRKPAIQKTKMLEVVRNILLRADYFEALIENDMMSAISEWLAPLPDKSLPALEIRTTLLKILSSFPHLEPGCLKQSGLGKAVMLIFKHPKETRDNKIMASKLIRNWSQPIFQISTDYASVTREEREHFDLEHLPESKRRRLEDRIRSEREEQRPHRPVHRAADPLEKEQTLGPGDPGFINRARVPKASTSAYIIRPKPNVEGNFRGESKNRQNSRFDRTQRDFKERTKSSKAARAHVVSLMHP